MSSKSNLRRRRESPETEGISLQEKMQSIRTGVVEPDMTLGDQQSKDMEKSQQVA